MQVFSMQHGTVEAELKRGAARGKRRDVPIGGGGGAAQRLLLRVDEEGVLFKSYRDGARVLLTPESTIAAQKALGADIIIPLDQCASLAHAAH